MLWFDNETIAISDVVELGSEEDTELRQMWGGVGTYDDAEDFLNYARNMDTGYLFGVSDNAIKNWFNENEKAAKPKGKKGASSSKPKAEVDPKEDLPELMEYYSDRGSYSGGYDIDYTPIVKNGKTLVVKGVNGKRGRPSDAERIAISGRPTLPPGYGFVTGKPVDGLGNEMTSNSIKEEDENGYERGYTDSGFWGAAYYEIKKNK